MAVSISLSIAQNSQSIANNTSNVTVTLKASWTGGSHNLVVNDEGTPQAKGWVKIDGATYDFASTFNTDKTTSGSQTICSKTVNVSHNDDGTKTLSCSASYTTGVSSGTVTTSASKTLTTIPRKSTLSVGNGTLGTAQTLTVTEQASSFTHTIVAKCGSASTTVCSKSTSNSVSFTPPLTWASQNTTGTSVSVTYTITTYNGNTSVGSNSYTKTCSIPSSVKPSCTVSVSDSTVWYSTYGAYVKGYSKFKIVVTPELAYGSPIATYKTTANGGTYNSSSFTTAALTSSGTLNVVATVTDKRGRTSAPTTVSLQVLDYAPPHISKFSVGRCDIDGVPDDQGEYVHMTFEWSISSLNSMNGSSGVVYYKKSTESNYINSGSLGTNSGKYVFKADTGSSYDIKLSVTDRMTTSTRLTSVSTAYTIMHFKSSGYGMGIGKVSELDNVLDIGMSTRMLGGITHPVLEPGADLDEIRTPNTYIGANVSTNKYAHCPLTTGTFTLEVVGMGDAGQVKQRLTYCHKTDSRAWERIYYSDSWGYDEDTDPTGGWICVSDFGGKLLASPGMFMTSNHSVALAEPVSKQRAGIVLVFSRYSSSTVQNYHYNHAFVSKAFVNLHPGVGSTFMMTTDGSFSVMATKYLYIHDDRIDGNDNNDAVGTGSSGVKYENNGFVLRYVIGV